MNKLTVDQLEVTGKRVLVRVDFNVPVKGGEVTDATRIKESLPTIQKLIRDGAKVILMSHLGRPKGPAPEFSLAPVRKKLADLLGRPVEFASDCVGPEAESKANGLKPGGVLLLENLRFHPEEEKNESEFAKKLARLGEVYVNDAFGTAHRAHASTEGVTRFFDQRAAGYLLQKELKFLGELLSSPKRPFVAILGGAKVSDKIAVIENLLPQVDRLLIGGGMAYTFMAAQGKKVGGSIREPERFELARMLLQKGKDKIALPEDSAVASDVKPNITVQIYPSDEIPDGLKGLDIGPKAMDKFCSILVTAQTVLWNGPMGVFEVPPFDAGTKKIGKKLAVLTAKGATTVVGGGDSAAACAKFGLTGKMSHISTGGGASLEFLEGKVLPGVAALSDA
ncbi:MAG: phosphoglycerate kinase [candidate division Zixibacteria bacterium]|nr:phosphoglycerate kinase [candidate division Zixibacteria bacterium]MCI0595902.1 phosphoglycerate kinase [candidate division Zixibacteria bacterium]